MFYLISKHKISMNILSELFIQLLNLSLFKSTSPHLAPPLGLSFNHECYPTRHRIIYICFIYNVVIPRRNVQTENIDKMMFRNYKQEPSKESPRQWLSRLSLNYLSLHCLLILGCSHSRGLDWKIH